MLERPKSPNVSHQTNATQATTVRTPVEFAHVPKHQIFFLFLTAAFGGRYHEGRHAHKLGPVFLASFSHVVCIWMYFLRTADGSWIEFQMPKPNLERDGHIGPRGQILCKTRQPELALAGVFLLKNLSIPAD